MNAALLPAALRLYRLGILLLIVWQVRAHHIWLAAEGDNPVELSELKTLFPSAARLRPDHSDRLGLRVFDARGQEIGYVVHSMPFSRDLIGYCSPIDVLITFDPALKVTGIQLRHCEETQRYVEDILSEPEFLKKWNGKSWKQVAAIDYDKAGIEGVSGATQTSMAIAESITLRLKSDAAQLVHRPPLIFRSHDIGLAAILILGLLLTFTHWHGRRWLRRAFQLVVIGYVGLMSGDLLAQKLLVGWAKSGVAWAGMPGMALLLAAAVLVPWATRKPIYCQQLCPHGALQEWLGQLVPHRFHLSLPHAVAAGLRWLPAMLLVAVLTVTMLEISIDLAGLEPFDAYNFFLRTAGGATVSIAVVGLLAALVIPQAYCKYGCPTGALLEFVRFRGETDRFGRRDLAAGLILILVIALRWNYAALHTWIFG